MTEKFPLFQLPYVALYEVLKHVRLEAMLPLSLCSKRSKLYVKDCQGPRKEININLDISENILKVNYDSVISVTAVSKLPKHLQTVSIGFHRVPVKMEEGILKTYWLNEKEGLKEVVKYTSDVFNRELHSISARGTSGEMRHWLEWIKTIQGKLRRVFLCTSRKVVDDDLVLYILESDTVTSDISLYCRLSYGFRGPSPRPFSIDRLDLQPSYWVTLNHLLAMDIKQISLSDSSLKCQEINIFLKKWINGECSKRIKKLYVDMGYEVDDVLMEGIEVTRRNSNLRREYGTYDSVECICGGLDIRRKEDGAMATVVYQPRRMSGLRVVFWPDYDGNPYH